MNFYSERSKGQECMYILDDILLIECWHSILQPTVQTVTPKKEEGPNRSRIKAIFI